LLLEEALLTDFKGSVYHPNLASLDIKLENGLRQTREEFQPTLTGELKNSSLDRFHIVSSFLRQKPYAFSLSADRARQIENHEFFERQTISSTSYAGNFGYKNKFMPANAAFNNSSKMIDRASRPSQNFQDDEFSMGISNESGIFGVTRLEAAQDKFSRMESGASDQNGMTHNISLSNQKPLFDNNKKMLNSYMHFYDLAGISTASIFNLNENLNIEHSDALNTSYGYSLSENSSAAAKAVGNGLSASLTHRLYDSLVSSFSTFYSNNDANTSSQNTYGVSLNEDYTKKLGKIGKFSSGAGLNYSEEARKAPGNFISVIDETRTLTTGGAITFLDKPRVDTATVVVTDTTRTIKYILNTDYQLLGGGERTQIQRVPGGSISDGQSVLVNYQAQSSPSLKFNTLGDNLRLRMDFLENLIGVYYRANRQRHPQVSGEENTILQTLTDRVVGMDFRYKYFEAVLEDEDYNSNLAPYKQLKLTESFTINPSLRSTLTLQSSQSKIRLVATQNTQRFFDFLSRYNIGLSRFSRLTMEAGYRWQDGAGINLNDLAAGSGFELNLNKFLLEIKYDFKRQSYIGDRLVNHFFSTRIKRSF